MGHIWLPRTTRIIRQPVFGSVFTPTDQAGIIAWYRMDLGFTVDGSNNITALNDQSGTGDSRKNLTPTGTIPRTASDAAYGNKPTITFNNTGQILGNTVGDWTASQAQPYTIYFTGHATSGRLFDGGLLNHLIANNGGVWAMHAGGGFINGAGTDPTVPSFGCGVFNGDSSALYITDPVTAKVSGGAGLPGGNACDTIALGNLRGGGANLSGKIAEIIVYSGSHNSTVRTTIMNYMKARYGL